MATIGDADLQRRPPKRVPSMTYEEKTEDGGDTCRICRGERTPEQPLYFPCKCSGSIKYVHQDCLMEWLSHSQKKYCELCKTPFRFTKLYDESMPDAVPWPLFMRQLLLHSFRAVSRWLRYSLAISIWLCWLPWTIRQIWRGLFWIADGSWLSTQEVRDAVTDAYAVHMANASSSVAPSISTMSANSTMSSIEGTFSILVPTLSAILGLLDPKIFLRAILKLLVSMAVNPVVITEPMNWSGGALLFAQISRPPSLLSDFQSIASATRSPILNNAFIDILEGQLICLAIITAFILVFLIREWVINQQPLLNVPDPDPAENAAQPQQDEPRRAARRRRRNRQLPGVLREQNERPHPEVNPLLRRVATENNILVQTPDRDQNRPEAPRRAASLVPALQELEENVRMIGDRPAPAAEDGAIRPTSPLESPPLQRGVFDDVGYIRRAIEEREGGSSSRTRRNMDPDTADDTIRAELSAPTLSESPKDERDQTSPLLEPLSLQSSDNHQQIISTNGLVASADEGWISESDTEAVPTPGSLSDLNQDQPIQDSANDLSRRTSEQSHSQNADVQSDGSDAHGPDYTPPEPEEPKSLWNKISDWLWDTDDYVDEEDPTANPDDSDRVVNIDGDNLLGLAPGHRPEQEVLAPAPPAAAENPAPNIQNGINVNNQDAVDDAEDLEGIMELLGMEGPIAGMVQNIIFSVFLITLTLSASIWCPYIWGKITLLFVAHPYSVFIRAPLYLLSRTADVIVDIGLFIFGILGVLLNQTTKLAKITLSLLAPSWSKRINPDALDKLSISLFQKSGSRLEKTFMKAVLGFRPDLPTFSVQAHHVLRVFTKVGAEVLGRLLSNRPSHLLETGSSLTWHETFMAPVYLGSFARRLPTASLTYLTDLKQWHAQLQEDLRPLSFSDPNEIDYSLVHWSSKEKIFCIALGYALFGMVGYIYLKIAPYVYGLKKDEKVTGFFADTLRQAGGVMKVIVIIGIEMIVFPLYCGTMLDFALLPIFEGATVHTRLTFFAGTPLTALFVHWFIGTCYMFHFALFVSMCRKIMRKGVLYFIRDPDDPTFHPVRDVLERPVATQLGKIAFSAFVYGSLLVICLGGVIAGLDRVGGILPLRWGVSDIPLIMPGDIVFFNFVLPFILRKFDLSEKLSTVFEWWFRACAGGLRLSDFMFGVDDEKEKAPSPFLWRQFFSRIFWSEEESIDEAPGPVKDLKQLAKNTERLLWFEADDAEAMEVELREAAGPNAKYKKVHQSHDGEKAQALIEFDDLATTLSVKKMVNEKPEEPGRTNLRAKSVNEIQIDIKHARDTQVDLAAGTYVRAPAKDSVRIPKGTKVFVKVNERNERIDGSEDTDEGLHGKKNENFSKIYVPNHFKARVLTFVAMVWGFVALAGLSLSIGPLMLGRFIVTSLMSSAAPVNDLYAFTIGFHALCVSGYLVHTASHRWRGAVDIFGRLLSNTRQVLPWITGTATRVGGLVYLILLLGVALPLALSFIAELYVNIPILAHLIATEEPVNLDSQSGRLIAPVAGFQSTPIINLIQTWTLGLLYLRFVVRILKTVPQENSRPAIAVRRIMRRGLLRPDIALATRALIIPIFVVCVALLGLPPLFARAMLILYPQNVNDDVRTYVYRYTYPAILFAAFQIYVLLRLRSKIDSWRVKIRDEVYLIGEKLHDYPSQEDKDKKSPRKKVRKLSHADKSKEKTRATSSRSTQTDYHDNSELLSGLATSSTNNVIEQTITRSKEAATTNHEQPTTPSDDISALGSATTKRRLYVSGTSQHHIGRFAEDLDAKIQGPSNSSMREITPGSSAASPEFHQSEHMQSSPSLEDSSIERQQESEHKPTLEDELDDFKDVTGLHEMSNIDDLGDVGRQVFGNGMHGGEY